MFYSLVLKNIVLALADKILNTSTNSYLRQIEKMRFYTPKEISNWQEKHLKQLIVHAYNNTAYYRRIFDNLGLLPSDIATISDLKKLPILTKLDIINNFEDLTPKNLVDYHYQNASTGGSTGDPLKYLRDNKSWSFSNANNIYNWQMAGYNYGDKFIALGSTSLFVAKKKSLKHSLYYLLKRKIGLNGINMSDNVCKEYVTLLRSKNIKFIYGYASSIYLLAKYCLTNSEVVDIKACFPTSEVLTDEYYSVIKQVFKCNIVNCYGAHDGGITAYNHNNKYFEVGYNCLINLEDNQSESEDKSALLTDLLNYTMPLINYRIGDQYVISVHSDISYNGQTINRISGRTSDILKLENGKVLTGPGFTILFKELPVKHYCIQKIGRNKVRCFVFKGNGFDDDHEKIIIETLNNQLGNDTDISIEYTKSVIRTKSGKIAYFLTDESLSASINS